MFFVAQAYLSPSDSLTYVANAAASHVNLSVKDAEKWLSAKPSIGAMGEQADGIIDTDMENNHKKFRSTTYLKKKIFSSEPIQPVWFETSQMYSHVNFF